MNVNLREVCLEKGVLKGDSAFNSLPLILYRDYIVKDYVKLRSDSLMSLYYMYTKVTYDLFHTLIFLL